LSIRGSSIFELQDTSLLLLHEDVGESYEALTRSAAAAVGAESCSIALYDAEADQVVARRPSYRAPGRPVPQYRFPLAASRATARVVRTREPYVCNDPARDPLYDPSVGEAGVRSVLTVPIRRGDRVLGLFYALNKPGGFSDEHVQTLQALAGAAAVTLENVRLYAREREQRVLNESLREVSRALVATLTEDAALATVLDQMWRVVRYQAAAALVLRGNRLRVAASRGGDVDVEVTVESTGELLAVVEERRTAWLSGDRPAVKHLGLGGSVGPALAVPLLARGQALGALVVAFEPESAPGEREAQLVSAFSDHAALFLEAGAVVRRERQARSRAAAVARITRLAATRHEPESLLQAVAPEILALSGADRVVLYLKAARGPLLQPIASAGLAPDEEVGVFAVPLDLGSRPLAALAEGRQPILFRGAATPPPPSITPFAGTRSLLLIPLVTREEILGAALLAIVEGSSVFDEALVAFLSDLAQQVALGVENARLFSTLAQLASTDELTQLANRRRFTETLRLELARAKRTGGPVSLVLADIDHLKRINDTHGHPAGDAAIRHVADALRRRCRETDIASRLGGEEFALLLPATDKPGAVRAAERVRRELAQTEVPTVGAVTVSLGVATYPEDGATEQALVRVADRRLYAAKAAGRNQVCDVSFDGTEALTPPSDLRDRPRWR
jgi:diguanylate cyclase (GGDEF)-like protein